MTSPSPTQSRLWWTWVALATALVCYLFVAAIPMLVSALAARPWDGVVDWTVAKAWFEGINPYTPEALKASGLPVIGHPPTTSFWFLPLAHLSMAMMSQVIGHLVVVLMFLQTVWICRTFRWPTPALLAAILTLWAITTTWMQYHLYIAQVSEVLGFAFVVAWLALRRRWDVAGGLVLGAALTIKLFPGLVIFWLLLQRRWKAVFAAAGMYLAVAIIMTSRLGFGAWKLFLAEEPEVVRFWIGHPHNSTFQGLWHRFLAPGCGWTRTTNQKAILLAALSTLVFFGITYVVSRRRQATDSAGTATSTFDLTYFAVVIVSVLGNPFAFGHYTAIYLPIGFVVAAHGWRERDTWAGKVALLAVIAVYCCWRSDMYAMDPVLATYERFRVGHLKYHLLEATQYLPPFILVLAIWNLLRLRNPPPPSPT